MATEESCHRALSPASGLILSPQGSPARVTGDQTRRTSGRLPDLDGSDVDVLIGRGAWHAVTRVLRERTQGEDLGRPP